jgi:hypothetical protein
MKKFLAISLLVLAFVSFLAALPLTVIIFQKSDQLAKKVDAWNRQCGDKPSYDETCTKKRQALSGELGRFVALVNDELDGLRDISPDASADFVREVNGRRKIMEHEIRVALYDIKCLGVPASDPQCKAEAAAIDQERVALQPEYERTHAVFDGEWISIPVTSISISPAPKKVIRNSNASSRRSPT